VVLDPFSLDGCRRRINTDRGQKLVHDLVSFSATRRQTLPLRSKCHRLIRFRNDQPFPLETFDDSMSSHVADTKTPRKVRKTTNGFLLQNLCNRLDVVLRSFGLMSRSGSAMRLCFSAMFGHRVTFGIQDISVFVLLSILMGGILSAEFRNGDSRVLDYSLVRHDPMALTIRDSG
jgi:hypothetical protein